MKDRDHMSNEQLGMDIRRLCKEKQGNSVHTLYQKFLELYDNFIQQKIGVGAKIDGREGQAMKTIIQYITTQSKDKTDEGVINSWKYILENWGRLPDYYRQKLRLTDINSNLTNILNQFKNGKTKSVTEELAQWNPDNH